ncbi:hypothetical protein OV203_02425 [Nannocystis sp. ILAH1]|uniref:hypothetical protein n=1 Tax=Nannocystis sp. ILAH1 TaxID=2996789 RepID=UPI00226F8550|nr:hypothetical protein [Nannocystis sp. ILAH1]MCY0985967.1 hypothetical protein [Nannocystis sp. ILAH1]
MPIADLAASSYQETAFLLVVEGWPYMFTDRVDLAGSGVDSWIGTVHGERIVVAGLEVPALEDAVVLDGPSAGMLEDTISNFKIVDHEGVMIKLAAWAAKKPTLTAERLSPRDDPAPPTILGMGGTDVPLWGKYISGEAIGPAGERRYWGGIPGATTPGMDHATVDSLAAWLAPVEVSDEPRWVEGQRCYLYLLRRDPLGRSPVEHENWAPWQEQYDSGHALIWWGRIRKGSVKGRTWTLPTRGRASFLRKLLNINCPATWSKLDTQNLQLGPGENFIASGYGAGDIDGVSYEMGASIFDTLDVLPTQGTPLQFINALAARLQTTKALVGPWTFTDYFDVKVDTSGFHLQVHKQIGGVTAGGVVTLVMHEKVWRYLGYDVTAQAAFPFLHDDRQIHFVAQKKTPVQIGGQSASLPAKGYYRATFSTKALGTEILAFAGETPEAITNNKAVRSYRPLTPGGALVLRWDTTNKQEVGDGAGFDTRYIEGQLARPPMEYLQNGTQQVDQTRWFLFKGKRRASLTEDPTDFYAVAKVAWKNQNGYFLEDPQTAFREFVIERWWDPRYFGYPFMSLRELKLDWVSAASSAADGVVEYVPLAALMWQKLDEFEAFKAQHANVAAMRVMLSSGTSEWSGFGISAVQSAGLNNPPSPAHEHAGDFEIADLGLCIPHEIVDDASFIKAANNLPGGGIGSPLNMVRYAWAGPRQSEDVLCDLLTPRAWFFSLKGNKYGLVSLNKILTEYDVDVDLNESDIGVDDDVFLDIPEVDLRPVPPIDRVEITYGFRAGEGQPGKTLADAGSDPGVRARYGNHELSHRGMGLLDLSLFAGTQGPPSWVTAWRTLWGKDMAAWASSPLVMVRGLSIAPPKSLALQVGSVVRLTNPIPATVNGTYGLVNCVGRVVRKIIEPDTLRARVDILLQPYNVDDIRRFAPVAMVIDDTNVLEERYDAANLTFHCYGDYFGCKDGRSDVNGFTEPTGWTIGGHAGIDGWQYDGREWRKTFTAQVASIDTTAHTITLTAPLVGKFYNRMRTMIVLTPYDNQPAAWVKKRFLVNTRADGTFGVNNTKGWPLL